MKMMTSNSAPRNLGTQCQTVREERLDPGNSNDLDMKDLGNSSNSKVIRDSNNIFVGVRMIEDFEEVAESFLAGDVVAFEQTLDHHGPSLMRYTTRLLNSKSLAEDIVQETFLRLWINREKYDPSKSKLSTWLHRVAYNLCMDVYRGIK